jgi:hypothetical protein
MIEKYLPIRKDLEEINENKLNKFVRSVFVCLKKKFPTVAPESLLMDSITLASILACHLRVKVASSQWDTPVYPNVYTLKIMGSNKGKDAPFNFLQSTILDDIILDWRSDFRSFRDNYHNPMSEEQGTSGERSILDQYLGRVGEKYDDLSSEEQKERIKLRYAPRGWRFEINDSTPEGLVAYAQTLKMWQKGLVYIRIREFGTFFTSVNSKADFMSYIMEGWDTGQFGGKLTKGERSTDIVKDIPCVFLGGTATSWLEKEKDKEVFLDWLAGGNARRVFICYPEDVEIDTDEDEMERVKRQLNEEQEAYEMVKDIRATILDKYMSTDVKKLILTREASLLYRIYQNKCNDRTQHVEDPIIVSETGGRPWKGLRIAGLFAWLDGADEITVKHLGQSIYITELMGPHSAKYREESKSIELPGEKLLNYLLSNPEPRSTTEIRKRNFMPYHRFDFDRLIRETREIAFERGFEIIVQKGIGKGGGTMVYTQKIEDTDLVDIPLMVADIKGMSYKQIAHLTKYKQIHTTWDKLPEVVTKYSYMPQLCNGKRAKDNFIPGGVLMGMDVDEGWSLLEARDDLEKLGIKAFLVTTPSHQKSKDKNGKSIEPTDRFRILIPLATPFTGDVNEWQVVADNFLEFLDKEVDSPCTRDVSRAFFPSPEDANFYYVEGQAVEWRHFNQKKRREQTKTAQPTTNGQKSALDMAIEYANEKFGVVSEGSRDVFLNNVWSFNFKEKGLSQQETYEICQELNKRFCNPAFSDKEMEKWNRNK